MSPLAAYGLHRFYRRGGIEVAALLDIGFACVPGESVAVMGPSGSGKSTLLALLAGLDDPDGGQVVVAGELLSHASPAASARLRARRIGVLTQAGGLLGHLSVLQNAELAGVLRRRAGGGGGPSARELVDLLGLRAVAQARPATLSGGETARAGLAVALSGNPDVLLADEPTAEVSSSEETDVLRLLHALRPAHGATVVVTHSEAVARSCDRVLRLRDGRLVA